MPSTSSSSEIRQPIVYFSARPMITVITPEISDGDQRDQGLGGQLGEPPP